ncbi:hypothetical protein EHS25_000512 [Saitozyma podzolica]|uniref:Apple domain-containing protein n=1 Tax=Saitozyma podzolica TaxID=1890683 RepID=A0A427YWF5_9TREE|nr:hypothetical protein EHS25_000512 [Saitozyma podzolica]
MRLSLPLLSLLLLACGLADARPATFGKRSQNATLAEIIAKRQTNRQNIALRAHVKDTIKRVQTGLKEKAVDSRAASPDLSSATASVEERSHKADGTRLLLPRDSQTPARKRDLQAQTGSETTKRSLQADGTRLLLPRDSQTPARKRDLQAQTGSETTKRSLQADGTRLLLPRDSQTPTRRDLPAKEGVKKRSTFEIQDEQLVQETDEIVYVGGYPRCPASVGRKTGYAHYAGWKLAGDDLSGGLPVSPESACIETCNAYGGACSGVYFDHSIKKCFLKGTHTGAWTFEQEEDNDGVDLVGGCSLWSAVVPAEMDESCCVA